MSSSEVNLNQNFTGFPSEAIFKQKNDKVSGNSQYGLTKSKWAYMLLLSVLWSLMPRTRTGQQMLLNLSKAFEIGIHTETVIGKIPG